MAISTNGGIATPAANYSSLFHEAADFISKLYALSDPTSARVVPVSKAWYLDLHRRLIEAHRMMQQPNTGMQRSSPGEFDQELDVPSEPARRKLLKEALQIVSVDRNSSYGNPEDNFANIAAYWNSYLTQRFGSAKVAIPSLNAQDVAHLMILMKMARLATNPAHRDSLVDIAGYAACGADCQYKG